MRRGRRHKSESASRSLFTSLAPRARPASRSVIPDAAPPSRKIPEDICDYTRVWEEENADAFGACQQCLPHFADFHRLQTKPGLEVRGGALLINVCCLHSPFINYTTAQLVSETCPAAKSPLPGSANLKEVSSMLLDRCPSQGSPCLRSRFTRTMMSIGYAAWGLSSARQHSLSRSYKWRERTMRYTIMP